MRTKRKNPAAVALGSLGGKASGKVRKLRISKERLSEIGKIAINARWERFRREQAEKAEAALGTGAQRTNPERSGHGGGARSKRGSRGVRARGVSPKKGAA